jgi:hypothetical protein
MENSTEVTLILDDELDCFDNRPYEEYEPEVTHGFSDKVYLREIFMKANSYVIGKLHKTEHFNIILKGSAYVMMNDDVHYITAPFTFVSPANTRKILFVTEDMIWQTVHVNPDNTKEVSVLEERYVDDTPVDPSTLIRVSDMIRIGDM